jgi:iron-sulfur cluster assembly protein
MAVKLTEAAAGEIKRVMEEQNFDGKVLRVGIAAGGCSGFQYSLTFDESWDEAKDHMTEQHGVQMVVDKRSDLHLDGTTLDFYTGLEKRGFTFDNPNTVKSCGCGSSFSA